MQHHSSTRRHSRKTLAAAVSVIIATVSGNLLAAELEEIVVTAERREMQLQDTPISIMAFSGEKLEARGVRDMMDMAAFTPNLDIKGSRGTGNTSPIFQIRGIGGASGATGERSVGFYVDDVFMPRTTGPVMKVLDVDRIEVLRGPQGTLFGRNSTGGAIRVFSKQAGPEKDGYIRLNAGNFGHTDLSGMFNVPLSDTVYLRAQAAKLKEDGFVQRGPQDLGSTDDEVARVQMTWKATPDLQVDFGLLYSNSSSDGSPTDMIQFNMDPICPTNPAITTYCLQGNYADWVSDFLEQNGQARLSTNDPRLLRDQYSMPSWCFLDGADPDWDDMCKQWNRSEYTQANINAKWTLSNVLSLRSTTGWSKFRSSGVSDWQLLGMEYRPSSSFSEVFYQEVQLNYEMFDGFVDLVSGANYFQEDAGTPREALYQVIGSSVFNATTGGTAFGNLWGCAGSGTTPPLCSTTERRLRVTGDGSSQQDSAAWGLFANATFHFGKQWNLTLGVRESWDEKDFTSTLFAADNFIPQNGVSTTVNASDDWQATDWRATLDWHINDDIMFYVTASKAFRSGSYTVPAAVAPAGTRTYHLRPQPAAIPPEYLRNNEIGMRSEWFNKRLRVNATYYEMDFTNRQGGAAVADPNAPTGFTIQLTNQGDVELSGTEIEAQLVLTDNLSLEAAAGWADYKLENVCINNGPFLFPAPMDKSWSLAANYNFKTSYGNYAFNLSNAHSGPMQTHPGGFTAEENAIYNCGAFAATFIDSRYEVPSYDVVNASIRFTPDEGKWAATVYVNNLADEAYANNAQSFGRGFWTQGGPAGGTGLSAPARSAVADYRGRPREYGVMMQYNF